MEAYTFHVAEEQGESHSKWESQHGQVGGGWETRGHTSLAAEDFVLGVNRILGSTEPDRWGSQMPC